MPATKKFTAKFYALATLGAATSEIAPYYTSEQRAMQAAFEAKGTGTCSTVRVYECDSVAIARTVDIGEVRRGERVIATV